MARLDAILDWKILISCGDPVLHNVPGHRIRRPGFDRDLMMLVERGLAGCGH